MYFDVAESIVHAKASVFLRKIKRASAITVFICFSESRQNRLDFRNYVFFDIFSRKLSDDKLRIIPKKIGANRRTV